MCQNVEPYFHFNDIELFVPYVKMSNLKFRSTPKEWILKYSRNSNARTSFGQWIFDLAMGRASHRELNQSARSFRSSIK